MDILYKQPRTSLIELRKSKKLHQKDVAKAMGITTSYYGMIELGVRTPNLKLAQNIAEFLGEKIDVIFFVSTNNKELSDVDKTVTA